MKKFFFLLIYSTSLSFFCCQKKDKDVLQVSVGKINNISVLVNDAFWNGEIGDSIRSKFATPVLGLPQEEPLFNINQYHDKLLDGFLPDERTLVMIKIGSENSFQIIKDKYATPQQLFKITGKTTSDILEILEENSSKMIQLIKESEIKKHQKLICESLLNVEKINQKFNINIFIPSDYQFITVRKHFVWLKKEVVSGSNSLLIYEVPLSSVKKNKLVSCIVHIRDSIGNLYIRGKKRNSYMLTERDYSPYFSTTSLTNKIAYETKGTWELKNDFMSGPFINYAIEDKENNRLLVLEGFSYSPSKGIRDYTHELESIIKSVVINSKKNRKKTGKTNLEKIKQHKKKYN